MKLEECYLKEDNNLSELLDVIQTTDAYEELIARDIQKHKLIIEAEDQVNILTQGDESNAQHHSAVIDENLLRNQSEFRNGCEKVPAFQNCVAQ